jgi:hypothetical protein
MIGSPIQTLALLTGGGVRSILRREADGTVTVLSLAFPWRPYLVRETDGTVTVN